MDRTQLCRESIAPVRNVIPRIIHQTWKTRQIPEANRQWVESLKQCNPGYRYMLWDDSEVEKFIFTIYPEYIGLYRRLQRPVERADLFRYLVVHHYGGIYADLDVECMQALEPLVSQMTGLFCCIEKYVDTREAVEYYQLTRNAQICQWFFGAPKGFNTLKKICDRIEEIYPHTHNDPFSIDTTLEYTGPGVFSDIILAEKLRGEPITVFPQYYFAIGSCYTTGFEDSYPYWVAHPPAQISNKHELVFVKHHFQGTWKGSSVVL